MLSVVNGGPQILICLHLSSVLVIDFQWFVPDVNYHRLGLGELRSGQLPLHRSEKLSITALSCLAELVVSAMTVSSEYWMFVIPIFGVFLVNESSHLIAFIGK